LVAANEVSGHLLVKWHSQSVSGLERERAQNEQVKGGVAENVRAGWVRYEPAPMRNAATVALSIPPVVWHW
jgi:hypothetical protein